MLQDFMMRMFSPILWREERDLPSQEELRPLSFARLRRLVSCETCGTSCCGQAA
jgi:hypothetical protein